MRQGLSILLLATALVQFTTAQQISFGEIDYRSREDGGITVDIIKTGENVSPLTLIISPISDAELMRRNLEIPTDNFVSEFLTETKAQFVTGGRQDFDNTEQTITFPANPNTAERAVDITFFDDDINEALEVFYIVVRADNSTGDVPDSLSYVKNGIALAVIDDNDPISLTFENRSYGIEEEDRTYSDLVRIVKENGVLTEQTLEIVVQLVPLSAFGDAERGNDFNLGFNTSQRFMFAPDVQTLSVPFSVIDDGIAENVEEFQILLTVAEDTPRFSQGTHFRTSVFITDDESADVGFEQSVYTVQEGEDVELCVRILSPNEADVFVFLLANTVEDTATAIEDFTGLTDFSLQLFDDSDESCVSVTIVKDDIPEGNETFNITLIKEDLVEPNVELPNPQITILILGDEVDEPVPDCDSNARRVETQCICNSGYTGDGLTCTDINECSTGADNCHANARCINTAGSYRCQCRPGYTGNGFICRDINECRQQTDRCHSNALCTNTRGSYRCNCRNGYRGNGFSCLDINECALGRDNCHRDARCTNTPGSFECTCRAGFTGSGRVCRPGVRPPPLTRPSPPLSDPTIRPTAPPQPSHKPRPDEANDPEDDCDTTTSRSRSSTSRSRSSTSRSRSSTSRSRPRSRTTRSTTAETRSGCGSRTGTRTRSSGTHTKSSGTHTATSGADTHTNVVNHYYYQRKW